MKLVPYKIVNKDGKPYIQVQMKEGESKVFSPEEISAMVLIKMKETAEAFLGKKIKDAVVTVPGKVKISCFGFKYIVDLGSKL
jgi:heat shock protein 5